VIVDGTALAVHFAFLSQYNAFEGNKGVRWTDALDRYTAYADEMVCPGLVRPEMKSEVVVPEIKVVEPEIKAVDLNTA